MYDVFTTSYYDESAPRTTMVMIGSTNDENDDAHENNVGAVIVE